ncbi:PHP domain-containing protein, partial [Lysinibacillus sp. D4A1_S13]
MAFVHLQVHSGYSLLNSAASVKELIAQAKELGYSSMVLTDENV